MDDDPIDACWRDLGVEGRPKQEPKPPLGTGRRSSIAAQAPAVVVQPPEIEVHAQWMPAQGRRDGMFSPSVSRLLETAAQNEIAAIRAMAIDPELLEGQGSPSEQHQRALEGVNQAMVDWHRALDRRDAAQEQERAVAARSEMVGQVPRRPEVVSQKDAEWWDAFLRRSQDYMW